MQPGHGEMYIYMEDETVTDIEQLTLDFARPVAGRHDGVLIALNDTEITWLNLLSATIARHLEITQVSSKCGHL